MLPVAFGVGSGTGTKQAQEIFRRDSGLGFVSRWQLREGVINRRCEAFVVR